MLSFDRGSRPNLAAWGAKAKPGALALLAALLLACAPAAAIANPDLVLPWPAQETAALPQGERITFASASPFTLSNVGNGAEEAPPTEAQGTLYLPPEASAAAPVPAVVILHGASGVQSVRELTYARQFAAQGTAALVIDVFAARRDRASSFINRLLEITEAMFLADAYAGLEYLAALPQVDGDRVALIGFSYGGMVTTYAAYAQVAERYAPEGPRFAAHVAFYAPCIAEFQDSRATGAPLLMLYGGRDAIVDPERCARIAEQIEAGGGDVETVVYPDAVHQWDGRFAQEREIGRNLADCRFVVEADGTVRDKWLWLPMSSVFSRKIILGLCAGDEGYLIGRNDAVRAQSNRVMGAFLERALAGGKS
ncbi:dienelactone hydrolase family protein [Pelagibius sp. 7325]|uniref:dienelactone hydrolase family protein n=1 Tax=Pelagibius sp. 7325 TaxID=3131994 RepID=UPI0030EC8A33